MEELIDVLDEFGNKTGIIKPKSEIKRNGYYHRAIAVLVLNNDNILIQRRSDKKRVYPRLWSIFVKGHVKSGESSIEASIRELKEEIGVSVLENELEYLYSLKEEKSSDNYIENIFYDTYLLRKIIELNDIIIEEEELSDIRYMNIDEVYNLINSKSNNFVPNDEDYKRIFKLIRR